MDGKRVAQWFVMETIGAGGKKVLGFEGAVATVT